MNSAGLQVELMKSNRADGTDAFNSSSLTIAFGTAGEPDWMMVGFSVKLNDTANTNNIEFTWNRETGNGSWGTVTTSTNYFH
jgi:hypothetical protein